MAGRIPGSWTIERLIAEYVDLPSYCVRAINVATDADIARSQLAQTVLDKFPLRLESARVWDDLRSISPAAGANDDLGLISGGTGLSLQTGDLASSGTPTTRKAALLFALPSNYDPEETITLRVRAKVQTAADQSATVDASVYVLDRDGGVGSDIVTTAEQSLTTGFANYGFVVTPTDRAPGDVLLIVVSLAIHDDATGSGVIGKIGAVEVLADTRG